MRERSSASLRLGEVGLCALNSEGVPVFSRLQATMDEGRTDQLVFFTSALLFLNGEGTTSGRTQCTLDSLSGEPKRLSRDGGSAMVEVTYLTWTEDNLLRQVSYQDQREDKPARQVVRATPMQMGRAKPKPSKTNCWGKWAEALSFVAIAPQMNSRRPIPM
jgi:hypothetical protein